MTRKISNNCLAPQATEDELRANEKAWRSLGLPDISTLPPHSKHLAIVGGGPSINLRKNALRKWRGDIWAVNHAALWCASNQIDCSMFTICPGWGWNPEIATVKQAIVATQACQELIGFLHNTKVVIFELGDAAGPGSAPSAIPIAMRHGYETITFFGCEGSFPPGQQHGYEDVVYKQEIVVALDSQKFLTTPAFLMSALWLARLIRNYPDRLKERSGGLLSALIRDPDYDVVGISGSKNQEMVDGWQSVIDYFNARVGA